MKFDYTKKYYCCLQGLSEPKLTTLWELVNDKRIYDRSYFRSYDNGVVGYNSDVNSFGVWEESNVVQWGWVKLTFGEFIQLMEGYEKPLKVGGIQGGIRNKNGG